MSYKIKMEKIKAGDKWVEKFVKPSVDCSVLPSMTVQADAKSADINHIMEQYEKRGFIPPLYQGQPFYGDVSELGDLQDSLIKVREAEELFAQYPAKIRERFDNDYVKFIEFLENEANRKEAEELGIINKRTIEPAQPAPSPVAAGDGAPTQ